MAEEDWRKIWDSVSNIELNKGGYVWKFYETLLGDDYDFRGRTVLEFGCGTGMNSIMMAKKGAKVTFVDSTRESLKIVKRLLKALNLDGELVLLDVFDSDFKNEFDLVHSEGLVEHFLPPQRQGIVDVHAMAAKKGGDVLLMVPHSRSPLYRLGKYLSVKTGTWIYGNEYPYTKHELKERMRRAGLRPGKVTGGEFLFSALWLFSPLTLSSPRLIKYGLEKPASYKLFRLNYSNMFADMWGRVIGCVGRKS